MKIVFVHMGVLPVKTYGGTERIMFWHMCELAKLGHKVVLIGNKESDVKRFGIELIALDKSEESKWPTLVPKDADIVHLQYNWKEKLSVPHINTVHGNGQPGEVFYKNTVFVSKRHAEIHNAKAFIHNAIALEEYPYEPPTEKKWEKFLFLAKASWRVKNVKHAVKVCKKNKKHIYIAGGKVFSFSKYVHNEGMVGGEKKMSLLRNTDALIFPVRWEEPFGIAIIEAMSQGRPVIGSPYGSLKELITSETGIICHNYEELEKAVSGWENKFNPDIIRKYVEDNFSVVDYTKKYLECYERVITGQSLNDSEPVFKGPNRAEDLLPY